MRQAKTMETAQTNIYWEIYTKYVTDILWQKKSQIKYSIFKKVLKFFCSLVNHKIVRLSVFWIRCRVRWNQRFFWRKWATQVLSLWTDPKCWMLSTWLWSGRSTLNSRYVEILLHANFNLGKCQGLDCVQWHLLQLCVT